jgi:hypothetical protein
MEGYDTTRGSKFKSSQELPTLKTVEQYRAGEKVRKNSGGVRLI